MPLARLIGVLALPAPDYNNQKEKDMRKIFVLIALALLVSASSAMAVTPVYEGASGLGELKTVVLINAAGDTAKTTLSATYIIPGKVKIVGVSVNNVNGGNTENYVALADAASGGSDSYLMAELEAPSTEPLDKDFPLGGLSISSGLEVRQGAQTCVTVYYVQVRP